MLEQLKGVITRKDTLYIKKVGNVELTFTVKGEKKPITLYTGFSTCELVLNEEVSLHREGKGTTIVAAGCEECELNPYNDAKSPNLCHIYHLNK